MKIKKPNRGKYSVVTVVKCPICSKEVKARGLAGHLSIVHNIKRVIKTTHTNEIQINTSEPMPGMTEAPKVVERRVTERVSNYVVLPPRLVKPFIAIDVNEESRELPDNKGLSVGTKRICFEKKEDAHAWAESNNNSDWGVIRNISWWWEIVVLP
jgi:hypothetical protein